MLDRLKDIVPEVNENKANLIYQKSLKPKKQFNYQLVLRFALFIFLLVPIFVVIGLNNNGANKNAGANESVNSDPIVNVPNDNVAGEGDESINDAGGSQPEYFTSAYSNGVLELYFYDSNDVYYLKQVEGYNIISVIANGENVVDVDGVYCVNALTNITVIFDMNSINDVILLMISTDNQNFYPEHIAIG